MSDRGLTQDILLRIKAENKAQADLKSATDAVNNLTAAIDKQKEAARTGVLSEKELRTEMEKLNAAANAVTGIRSLIDSYKNFAHQIDESGKKVDEAKAKLAAQEAAIAAAGKATAAQTKELKALQSALAGVEKSAEASLNNFNNTADTLKRLGVDTANLADAENRLKASYDQAESGIRQQNAALVDYVRNLKQAQAEAARLAEAEARQAEAAKAAAAAEVRAREEAAAQIATVEKSLADDRKRQRDNTLAESKTYFDAERKKAADAAAEALRVAEENARKQAEATAKAASVAEHYRSSTGSSGYDIPTDEERVARATREAYAKSEAAARRYAAGVKATRDKEEASRREDIARWDRYAADLKKVAVKVEAAAPIAPTVAGAATGGRRTDAKGKVGAGAAQTPGFLGLRPYEMVNLGYQVNDVVGGLLQGQRPLQIAAQQGPQFLQIFGTAALRWFPLVAVAAGAAAVAIGSVTRALAELASAREFGAVLATNANGIKYNVTALLALRKEIEEMSVSLKDANGIIKAGIGANIRSDRIKDFAQLAKDMSRVLGIEVPDAMKQLAAAFTGGEESIGKLNDSLNFLDAKDLAYIRRLYEMGQGEQARAYAFEKLSRMYREGANTALGPFAKAAEDLGKTWTHLMETLSKSEVIAGLISLLDDMVRGLDRVIQAIDKSIDRLKYRKTLTEDVQSAITDAEAGIYNRPPHKDTNVRSSSAGDQQSMIERRGTEKPPIGTPTTRDLIYDAEAGVYHLPRADTRVPSDSSQGDKTYKPGPNSFTNPNGLKLDTETLKQLSALLSEAVKGLPEGARVEAIATERAPGTKVAGKNSLSEHDFGRAIDVRIVDANGNVVPGSMGLGGPMYDALDKGMLAAAQKAGLGPLAIGSTFRDRKDAGHYSLGGSEAEQNARNRGELTNGSTSPQERASANSLRDAKEEIAIRMASSRESLIAAEKAKLLRAAQEEAPNDTARQNALVQARLQPFINEQLIKQRDLESELMKEKIDDLRHYQEIMAAGDKAEADARARGIQGFEQLRAERVKGQNLEKDRLTRLDAETDRLNAFNKSLEGLGNDKKNVTELDKALAAVEEKYRDIYLLRKKDLEQATPATRAQLEATTPTIERKKSEDLDEARASAYEKQASLAVERRTKLIATYNDLFEKGAISEQEREDGVKNAYELTTDKINEAAAALQKLLETSKNFSPERVAELTAEVKKLHAEAIYADPFLSGLRKTLIDSIGSNATTAFNTVSEAIGKAIARTGQWKDVLTSLKTAAGEFFAGILKDVAAYILKVQLLKSLSSLIPGLGLAAPAAAGATALAPGADITTQIFGAVAHGGGVIGASPLPTRAIPAYWFANAPRHHRGTMVGLANDEYTAILKRNEEVLSNDNPRNILNMAKQSRAAPEVKIRSVLVADPDLVPAAMSGAVGEKIVVQHLVKNAATVRQIVRG